VSDVEQSNSSKNSAARPPPLSLIIVSVLAASAAVAHLAFPRLTVDAVTLGLLAVAALPWLAPVVKSLKFGSFEIDLQDIRQNLDNVRNKVEENVQKVDALTDQVQKIVFSGAVDSNIRTNLEEAMNGFYTYVRQAGMPVPATEPHVEIVDRGPHITPMYFNARQGKILVARKLAGDTGRVLWSYCDYLCVSVAGVPYEQWSPQLRALKSGLALYLSCSYRRTPAVATESYEIYRQEASDARRGYLDTLEKGANLENNYRVGRLSAESGPNVPGKDKRLKNDLAIGGTFWRVREVLGAETTDRLLIESWNRVAQVAVPAAFAGFTNSLVDLVEKQEGAPLAKQVQEVLRRRGLAGAQDPQSGSSKAPPSHASA
jgi:hypothetical protein